MQAASMPWRRSLALGTSKRVLSTLTDERLVVQIRRGNQVAFEVVYDRYQSPLLSFCRHMLGSSEEAEDALQHTFVSAHRHLLASRNPIQLKGWLYAIARNRCLSVLRARREEAADEVELVTAGLSEQVQRREDLHSLLGDIRELPEEQRSALLLAELRDLSHVEIAEVIGCEVPKVKSLIFQARSGLIERRAARDTPCEVIREQLATLTGGALRRGPLRRHLKACPACQAFRAEVKAQRRHVAAILPVIPSAGLKENVLDAIGIGGGAAGGGGLAAGGAAIGDVAGAGGDSVLAGVLASGGALKLGTTAIVAGTVAAGGAVLVGDDQTARTDRDGGSMAKPSTVEGPRGGDAGASPRGPKGGAALGANAGAGGDDGALAARDREGGGSGGDSSDGISSGGGGGLSGGSEGRGGGGSGPSDDSDGDDGGSGDGGAGGGLGGGSGGGSGGDDGGGDDGGYSPSSTPSAPDVDVGEGLGGDDGECDDRRPPDLDRRSGCDGQDNDRLRAP